MYIVGLGLLMLSHLIIRKLILHVVPHLILIILIDTYSYDLPTATPTGSQVTFPSSRSRHTSESYTPATSPYGRRYGSQNVTASLTPTPTPNNNRLKFPRQKSVSESHNPGPAHSLTLALGHRVISPTSPAGSHDTRAARIRKDSTTSTDAAGTPYGVQRSLNQNSLHPLKFSSRNKSSSESSYATPTQSLPASLAMCERRVKGQRSMSEATDNEGAGPLQRQDSYEVAVENGEIEDYQPEEEDFSFPVSFNKLYPALFPINLFAQSPTLPPLFIQYQLRAHAHACMHCYCCIT